MRRLFHLQKKSDNSHKYYGSLSALCNDNADLGVSKFTLDRFDFESAEFETQNLIRKMNNEKWFRRMLKMLNFQV